MKIIDVEKLDFLVSEHTNQELSENKIGCKEVLIHQDGKCVYRKVFGTKSVGGDAAKQGMIYRAASMTKPITTAAVLQLIDKGLIGLEDKVSKFFPVAKDLKVAVVEDKKIVSYVPIKKEITVRNLLSHTSGIGCEPLINIIECKNNTLSLDEAIKDILSNPISFEPDEAQSYSPTEAFDVAAGIVEQISGCAFDEYLKENIFIPLNMTNTTFCPSEEQRGNMVALHNRTEDGKSENKSTPDGCVFYDYKTKRMPAGAGLVITADDYINFADMLCFGGVTKDNKRILSENAVKLMSSPQIPACVVMEGEKWGLGVRIISTDDYPYGLKKGCFGWSGAYGTHFWIDRENRISAVMMKNSCYDGGSGNKSACQLEKDVSDSLV